MKELNNSCLPSAQLAQGANIEHRSKSGKDAGAHCILIPEDDLKPVESWYLPSRLRPHHSSQWLTISSYHSKTYSSWLSDMRLITYSKLIWKHSVIREQCLHLSRWRPSSGSQSKNQWAVHYHRSAECTMEQLPSVFLFLQYLLSVCVFMNWDLSPSKSKLWHLDCTWTDRWDPQITPNLFNYIQITYMTTLLLLFYPLLLKTHQTIPQVLQIFAEHNGFRMEKLQTTNTPQKLCRQWNLGLASRPVFTWVAVLWGLLM